MKAGVRLAPTVYLPPLHRTVESVQTSCQNQSPSHNPPVTLMQTKSNKALINYLKTVVKMLAAASTLLIKFQCNYI